MEFELEIFASPTEFTDEETELLILSTYLGEPGYLNVLDRLWMGMSAYPPETFTEDTMGVVWEEIENFRTHNIGNQYYPYINGKGGMGFIWGITVYQSNIRKMLGTVAGSSGTIYLYSKAYYEKDDAYYYNYCPVTVTIAESDNVPVYTIRPSYTITDDLTLSLTNNTNTIIKNVSSVRIDFTAQAVAGHSMETYNIRNGTENKSYTWTTNYLNSIEVSETFTKVNSTTFYITVSDTHGYTTNDYAQIPNMVEYYPPTCTLETQAPSATGGITKLTAEGVFFNGKFGTAGDNNSLTVQCRYKKKDATTWSTWKAMSASVYSNNAYRATLDITGLDYTATYQFEARVVDSINTISSTIITAVSKPVFDWAEEDFNFNVPVTFQKEINVLNGNVNMKGASILRYTGNDTNNVVLSASGGHIYLRPQGTSTTTGEVRITPQGTIYAPEVIVDGVQLSQVIAVLQDIGLL